MSENYDEYLRRHRAHVYRGFVWLTENLPHLFDNQIISECEFNIHKAHDQSKFSKEEYEAYDSYFYGNRSYEVVQTFNKAWLHHIHHNPHHWQYWILIQDNPDEDELYLEIPYVYLIEMICDWWSFSWSRGNLYSIFDWYDERKNYIKMNPDSRKQLEDILNQMKNKIDELREAGETNV